MWSSSRSKEQQLGRSSSRSGQQHLDQYQQHGHLQCPMCDFRARYPSSLTRHMTTHSGDKPYSCSYCDYSATQKEHLERHMRRHTGERPYACPYCPYTSIQRISLQGHMRNHSQHQEQLDNTFTLSHVTGTNILETDANPRTPKDAAALQSDNL